MPLRFSCPVCKTAHTAPESEALKKIECASCGQRLQIPPASRAKTMIGETIPDEPADPPLLVPPPPLPRRATPPPPPLPMEREPRPALDESPTPRRTGLPIGVLAVGIVGLAGLGLTFIIIAAVMSKDDKPATMANANKKASPNKPANDKAKPSEAGKNFLSQPATEDAPGTALSGEDVFKRLVRSSVFIAKEDGFGSGFVVSVEQRLVVTNFHVVGNGKTVSAVFPIYDAAGELVTDAARYTAQGGQIGVRGEVIAKQASCDLALIRLERLPPNTMAVTLAGKPAAPGSSVFSVGGSGVGENLLWRLTKGTVRGRSHRVKEAPFGTLNCMVLETDSPVNAGDSGGPVMNDRGAVVAVVSHGALDQRQISGNIDAEEVRKFLAANAPK